MWETCAVDLRVHLPKTVAVEVEQVQRNDPEMLSRILYYAMTRRTIDPQRSRVGLGALLVGYFEGDEFIYAGKVGTGFDTALLLSLRARLDALEIPRSPFTKASGLPRVRAHWVRPELVAQVAFTEWTVHDKLRHSRLLGVN